MNQVCLVGRLTAKPELSYTPTNIPYTRFTIAVNRTFSNSNGERDADFIRIVVWRRQAENVVNYLDKGSQVGVTGRIQTGRYQGQDGQTRYTTDVVADNVQFLSPKNGGTTNNYSQNEPAPEPTPYDFADQRPSSNSTNVESDPFTDFGDNVSIDDNFLD